MSSATVLAAEFFLSDVGRDLKRYFFLNSDYQFFTCKNQKDVNFSEKNIGNINRKTVYLHRFSEKQPAKAGNHTQK